MKPWPLAISCCAAFISAAANINELRDLSGMQGHFPGAANKTTRTGGKTLHITAFRQRHAGSF